MHWQIYNVLRNSHQYKKSHVLQETCAVKSIRVSHITVQLRACWFREWC